MQLIRSAQAVSLRFLAFIFFDDVIVKAVFPALIIAHPFFRGVYNLWMGIAQYCILENSCVDNIWWENFSC